DLDSRVRGNDGTEASQVDLDSRVRGNDGAEDPWEGARRSLKIGPDWGPERLDLPDTLVLTTYQTLRDYQFSLAGIPWSVAIFDEAQNIKSPNTLQSRASKALNADFKLMVTGTPVENHLGEFWCLFDTLQPGFLGSYQDFRQNYIRPILKAPPNEAHQVREEIGRDLRERVGGFMLRRVKEDHLQNLPKKYIILGDYNEYGDFVFDERVVESMRGEQRALYEDVVNVTVDGMDRDEAAGMALCGLQQLRNVSLHPGLLREMPRLPATAEDAREICRQSGKLATLLRILDSIRERNEKVLIFIVNKRLQEMISVCVSRIYGVPTAIINGATKAVSKNANNLTRQGIIDQFQAAPGFNVLVLSPVAAGVGLTITAANNVIHLERHWNPAKEAQATDRAYRIGQTRDVYVYVPILLHPDLDSFDVNLNRLLTGKTSLKDAIITQEEVHTADFAQSGMFQQKCASSERRVNIEDADGLSEELFTALIAEIHARDAEQVLLKEGTHDVAVLSKKTGN
ncbi:MAG: DEAD/DEAH box helicase, partial [Gammaproteobacteria bacterium]|nr:DEAD/DEAH box helicase [Gammaproteobacteria bacterium]